MIFIISLLIVAVIAFFLTLRSMKGFEDVAQPKQEFTLFLIRNESAVNEELLQDLSQMAITNRCQISLERLMKGAQSVLVIFGPQTLLPQYPKLQLLELEDYLEDPAHSSTTWQHSSKASVNFSLGWLMDKKAHQSVVFYDYFLKGISLTAEQEFFLQIVFYPIKPTLNNYQVTIRAIVVEQDHHKRIALAKFFEDYFAQSVKLYKATKSVSTKALFESYKKRTIVPRQVHQLVLKDSEILNILGVRLTKSEVKNYEITSSFSA
jgi:hypothetical protein